MPDSIDQPARTLDSLTDDEANALYHIAFGGRANPIRYVKMPDRLWGLSIEVSSETYNLNIHQSGNMRAMADHLGDGLVPTRFNARKVLIYLALLGIQFE